MYTTLNLDFVSVKPVTNPGWCLWDVEELSGMSRSPIFIENLQFITVKNSEPDYVTFGGEYLKIVDVIVHVGFNRFVGEKYSYRGFGFHANPNDVGDTYQITGFHG
jgi:hypothetical protein